MRQSKLQSEIQYQQAVIRFMSEAMSADQKLFAEVLVQCFKDVARLDEDKSFYRSAIDYLEGNHGYENAKTFNVNHDACKAAISEFTGVEFKNYRCEQHEIDEYKQIASGMLNRFYT